MSRTATPRFRDRAVTSLVHALADFRTSVLETFLAVEALLCGIWILGPTGSVFTEATALSPVPAPITGAILAAHGVLALFVLGRRNMTYWCRRSALASFTLWLFIALIYVFTPPHLRFAVPLAFCQSLAALWCYASLSLRIGHPA